MPAQSLTRRTARDIVVTSCFGRRKFLYDCHNYNCIGGLEAEIVRTVIALHKALNMKNT